jgi:hypothetical protein
MEQQIGRDRVVDRCVRRTMHLAHSAKYMNADCLAGGWVLWNAAGCHPAHFACRSHNGAPGMKNVVSPVRVQFLTPGGFDWIRRNAADASRLRYTGRSRYRAAI